MKSPQHSVERIRQRFPSVTADAIALAITAVGFSLRLSSIRGYWNNADEGIYYRIAHAPLAIASSMIADNAHPPLYYYLLRAVGSVFDDFVWLRVPALLFGTLSIFALYRLGTRIGGAACGIAAAVMLALSPGAIELSQVARPYALQLLLLIGATGALLRYLQSRNPRLLVAYAIWMLAAAFTHYSSFLVLTGFVVALGFAAIARHFSARELRDLAIAHVPVLIAGVALYSYHVEPVLLDSAMRREALGSWLGGYFVTGLEALWPNFLDVFAYLAGPTLAGVGSIVFLISVGACLHGKRFALVGVCVSVVSVAAAASALSIYPFGGTRHTAYLAPFLALTMGMATAVVFSMGTRAVVGSALLLAMIVIARGPVAMAIGVTPQGPVEQPEFEITRAEVDVFRDSFERLRATPGVLFMDLSTIYTLLPLMREASIESEWTHRGADSGQFAWGERQVVVIPFWYMAVGSERINAPNHLWSSIRRAREHPALAKALERDAHLVSAEGMALPRSIRALSRSREERLAVVDDVSHTSHLSAFRLGVAAYQQQLASRVRERAAGQRPSGRDRADEAASGIDRVSIAN
ncbi:MAG: glycosyltransferase family 39 protein [Myxococcota bacterium]